MAIPSWYLLTVLQDNTYAIIFCWIFGVIALLANPYVIFVCTKIFKRKRKKKSGTVHTFLIGNLAINDFLGGLYLLILAIADLNSRIQLDINLYNLSCIAPSANCTNRLRNKWILNVGCSIARGLACFSLQLSGLLMLLLAIDRFIAIVRPYGSCYMTIRKANIIVFLFWLYSILIAIVIIARSEMYRYPYSFDSFINLCYYSDFFDTIIIIVTSISLTTIILTYLLSVIFYTLIVVSIKRSRRFCSPDSGNTVTNRIKAEKRIGLMTGLLAITNFISWFPCSIFTIFKLTEAQFVENQFGDKIGIICFLLLFINSSVNPIMFIVFTSKKFKNYCNGNRST
ncbi:G-protein coupled receptor GRL101-like protein [Trichoplax sp. H2]|nr:G-protein coupled receptor GRL101-like protein [Trichoplax sp. H2]|eukprot:RDD41383.1 G-protein coupled receptor GRL101-like protein [Trichoplax sp. H2]